MVQYSFALHSEKSIHINDVTEQLRASNHFSCTVCGKRMVAHINGKRKRHFQHFDYSEHDPETYLHLTAKQIFEESYLSAIENSKPVKIHRREKRYCNHMKEFTKFECSQGTYNVESDLTKKYKGLSVEVWVDNLKPDILLYSLSNPDDHIFIEFVVTHECDKNKLDSGKRIIEIKIRNEDDLLFLKKLRLINGALDIKMHNFPMTKSTKEFCKDDDKGCRTWVDYVLIFTDGTYKLFEGRVDHAMAEIFQYNDNVSKYLIREAITDTKPYHRYYYLMGELRRKKLLMKTCVFCAFHEPVYEDGERCIKCSKFKKYFEPTQALKCNYYVLE